MSYVKEREALCSKCVHKTKLGTCEKCGCIVLFKIRVPASSCPIGKWDAKSSWAI